MTAQSPCELSPRRLAALLEPEWTLDRPVLGDLQLFDIHRHETRPALIVELVGERTRVRLEVVPVDSPAQPGSEAGLSVNWVAPSDREAGRAAATRLLGRLARGRAELRKRWTVSNQSEDGLLQAVLAESHVDDARLTCDPDHALLTRDARHYGWLYGVRPRARRLAAAPGISMHYPTPKGRRLPPSGAVYPLPPRLANRREFRRYFAALGFGFSDGFARTVPTPHTFDRVRTRRSTAAPLRFALGAGRRGSLSARQWLRSLLLHDTFPVQIAPPWAVAAHVVLRRFEPRIPVDVGMLCHDMATHGMAYHAVSAEVWALLSERGRRAARKGSRGRTAALASFFEGDVTRACWDVWRTIDDPTEFAFQFALRCAPLERELARLGG